jgi:hypothetical protein
MSSRANCGPLLVALAACTTASPGPRIAVLPEAWATARPASAAPAAPRIARALREHQLTPIADDAAREALSREGDVCLDDLACLRRVGQRLGAGKLVTLKLAELGETVAVQLTLVDVLRGAREATLREVITPNEAARLTATLDVLGARVARQTAPQPAGSPTWIWLGAGGVMAGAIIALVAINSSSDSAPDTTIVPP